MAEWLSVAEGRSLDGLRLVLTAGVPGPWGEAAKAIFHVKGLDCPRIAQFGGQPNTELVAWTGEKNAPQALFNDEPVRTDWISIIRLGERLAADPPLIPKKPEQRALMFGLLHELAGEGGFGWLRRLMLFAPLMALPGLWNARKPQPSTRAWHYSFFRHGCLLSFLTFPSPLSVAWNPQPSPHLSRRTWGHLRPWGDLLTFRFHVSSTLGSELTLLIAQTYRPVSSPIPPCARRRTSRACRSSTAFT